MPPEAEGLQERPVHSLVLLSVSEPTLLLGGGMMQGSRGGQNRSQEQKKAVGTPTFGCSSSSSSPEVPHKRICFSTQILPNVLGVTQQTGGMQECAAAVFHHAACLFQDVTSSNCSFLQSERLCPRGRRGEAPVDQSGCVFTALACDGGAVRSLPITDCHFDSDATRGARTA